MIAPRRFLPSVSSLLALEAVDRLGSATAAAEELSLTHSAVSRQLKVLEEQIDVSLLRREGKGLALTPAGTTYAQSVRDVLHDLARASLRIKASGSRETLTLAIPPSFGTYWLTPRLREFNRHNPNILINLHTRLSQFEFNRESFDAAVYYGDRDWQGVDYFFLSGERVIPVAAPDLFGEGLVSADALLTAPLLHLETRPGAWEQWFSRNGCQARGLRGMLFDQYITMSEAAILGFGVALLPEFLAEIEIRAGRLKPLASDYLEVEGAYYLVAPQGPQRDPNLELLIEFLAEQPID